MVVDRLATLAYGYPLPAADITRNYLSSSIILYKSQLIHAICVLGLLSMIIIKHQQPIESDVW